MATFLLILKIIGIVLLVILAIIVGLILLLLLWPFFYKICFKYDKNIEGSLDIYYFFHLIRFSIFYDKEFNCIIKVLGIKIYDRNRTKPRNNNNTEEDSFEVLEADNQESVQSDTIKSKDIDIEKTDDISDRDRKSDCHRSCETEDTNTSEKVNCKEKLSLCDKLDKYIDYVEEKIENFFSDITSKIQELVEKYDYYDRILNSAGTEYVIDYLKLRLYRLCKHLKPYDGHINIVYGNEDPELVSKLYELYALLYVLYPKKTNFDVNFEEKPLNLNIFVKGRFVLIYIIIIALQVVFNKKVKKFFKLIKRED